MADGLVRQLTLAGSRTPAKQRKARAKAVRLAASERVQPPVSRSCRVCCRSPYRDFMHSSVSLASCSCPDSLPRLGSLKVLRTGRDHTFETFSFLFRCSPAEMAEYLPQEGALNLNPLVTFLLEVSQVRTGSGLFSIACPYKNLRLLPAQQTITNTTHYSQQAAHSPA